MIPKTGTITLIVNPKSGASSNKRLVSGFRAYLDQKGYSVKIEFTQSLEHGRQLAHQAAADPDCSLVVGAGGDGTIREVVCGMSGSTKPLLVLPCGTENLLANELGYDVRLETVINAFENGQLRSLDLGRANDIHFTSIAGFGFDGKVVHRVQAIRKGHISHLTYFWPIWRTFWDYTFPPMKVVVDQKELFDGQGLVFVGNISRYAIGLHILKKANYSDGLLDICIFRCHSCWSLLKHAACTVLKTHLRSKNTIYTQARTIRIESSVNHIPTELDGDPGPSLPLDISIIPAAIQVLVPPGAKPAGIRTRIRRMIG
ncbi:MAG: diacylglycerol kinase family protein [Anaerohalosphaeraceae bacterium]